MLPLMVASASFNRGAATSLSITETPASAQTCAMPVPICPAPTTPIFRMLCAMILLSEARNPSRRSALDLGQFGLKLGHRLIEVGHQAVVRNLKDRCFFVFVDRDDHLGVLHPGKMLDRTGNADRDVKLRGHHLAGLAD